MRSHTIINSPSKPSEALAVLRGSQRPRTRVICRAPHCRHLSHQMLKTVLVEGVNDLELTGQHHDTKQEWAPQATSSRDCHTFSRPSRQFSWSRPSQRFHSHHRCRRPPSPVAQALSKWRSLRRPPSNPRVYPNQAPSSLQGQLQRQKL